MKRIIQNTQNIELLAPAGDYESMVAAVENGANAIYMGGANFSARADAKNFSLEEIKRALDYCHIRNVKLYVTVNTLIKESEFASCVAFLWQLEHWGVDAFIIQDYGLARYVHKYFKTPMHASTQMTAHSVEDVKELYELGFSRVILARELSINEIKDIHTHVPEMELECFVHGALCYTYSGQCYMSGTLGNRSGNRGRCAQTCRLPYSLVDENNQVYATKKYLLSLKDNMNIDHLEELREAGCTSLKIEGRMKQPTYVAATTNAYREKLDNKVLSLDKIKDEVTQMFSRSGFTSYINSFSGSHMMSLESPKPTGVFLGTVVAQEGRRTDILLGKPVIAGDGLGITLSNGDMIGSGIFKEKNAGEILSITIDSALKGGEKVYKTYDKKLTDFWKKKAEEEIYRRPIHMEIQLEVGKKASLRIEDTLSNTSTQITGDVVLEAKNAPLNEQDVIDRMKKTGNTPYIVTKIEGSISADAFLAVSKLNELRRQAIEAFEKAIIVSFERNTEKVEYQPSYFSLPPVRNKKYTVLASTMEQLDAIIQNLDIIPIERLYVETFIGEVSYMKARKIAEENKIPFFAALPLINRFHTPLPEADGYLVRNIGDYKRVLALKKPIVLDSTFHLANNEAFECFSKADVLTMSSEISLADMEKFVKANSEVTVYGHNIFMTSVQCPVGLYAADKGNKRFCSHRYRTEQIYLIDRLNTYLPLKTDCNECFGMIYNDRPVYMLHRMHDLEKMPITYARIHFTFEKFNKVKEILEAVALEKDPSGDFTYGHFYQSVL